jgi:hypothetical protein
MHLILAKPASWYVKTDLYQILSPKFQQHARIRISTSREERSGTARLGPAP